MHCTNEPKLAVLGGPQAVPQAHPELFHWPRITDEDKAAVLDVLTAGAMSKWDITRVFEEEWAAYNGVEHALAYPNGTAALLGAMYGVGLGRGDEIICPSHTYWGSITQCFSLGATPVFADIHPESLCLDPADIERHLSPRTRAIMVVHYNGHPADMDAILDIARRHHLQVIEDVSRAQGSLYRGRMCGSLGDAAGLSMMSGKTFPIGEGGMLITNRRDVYERAIAFSHYERHGTDLTFEALRHFANVPLGGVKSRLNQMSSAIGRVQLKYYPERIAEIERAINRFWTFLEGVPGLCPHRVDPTSGSSMGGWFAPLGHYDPEALGGVPIGRFIEAVRAEGAPCFEKLDYPLHLHPVFNEADIYHDGKPTRIAFSDRDVRQGPGSLPISEGLHERCLRVPHFKVDDPERIEAYAAAYRKVARQAAALARTSHQQSE